jgi:hypothetical protein
VLHADHNTFSPPFHCILHIDYIAFLKFAPMAAPSYSLALANSMCVQRGQRPLRERVSKDNLFVMFVAPSVKMDLNHTALSDGEFVQMGDYRRLEPTPMAIACIYPVERLQIIKPFGRPRLNDALQLLHARF